jgi:hypothetical protein
MAGIEPGSLWLILPLLSHGNGNDGLRVSLREIALVNSETKKRILLFVYLPY